MTLEMEMPQVRPMQAPNPGRVQRVLVATNLYPDAVRPFYGTFVRTHVEALRAIGISVDVLAIRGYAGKQHYALGAARAAALNVRPPYDVVHAYYGLTALVARLQLRAPVVVTFTGGDLLGKRGPDGKRVATRAARTEAYKLVSRTVDATITRTPEMADVLPASVQHRNHVIPAGVDLNRFVPLAREDARARLGWPADEPTVIFVADPKRRVKNFALAEAAIETLKRERPDVRLRVAAAIEPDDIPVWMSAADALLLTSDSEGSPNVVKEAMASELPVVSTRVGDVPRRLDGIPGCSVCDPDPEALGRCVAAAIDQGRVPEARAAVAELSLENVTQRVLDVYDSVLR